MICGRIFSLSVLGEVRRLIDLRDDSKIFSMRRADRAVVYPNHMRPLNLKRKALAIVLLCLVVWSCVGCASARSGPPGLALEPKNVNLGPPERSPWADITIEILWVIVYGACIGLEAAGKGGAFACHHR